TNAPSYYARIQAVDKAGNLSAFSPSSTAVSVDLTSPTVGGGGLITVANVTSSTLNLNWSIGSDNASSQTNLRYLVYYSSLDNIDTLARVQANGTPFGSWTTNINSATVTGLTPNSSYFFNILVEDQAGNRTAYQSVNGDTSMSTPWTWTKGSSTGEGNPIYGNLNVGAAANTPGARKQGVSWTDGSGGLWLFGGALTSGGSTGYYNDLWKFDGTHWIWRGGSQSPNQGGTYGTLGVGNTVNVPGARIGAVSWTDSTNRLWLFGGYGYAGNGSLGYLNDLWKFDGTQWTWVSGSNSANTVGNYGSKGIVQFTNVPGARQGSVSWINSSNELWLFGGTGLDSGGNTVSFNDLWKFDGTDWTWISGSDLANQAGAYGTKGIGASENAPGARHSSVAWVNSSGHLFVYGGYGYDLNGLQGKLNDLWKFTGGSWTWIAGDSTRNNPGAYGQKGMAAVTNLPGARDGAMAWADSSGNFWLFGGSGFDNNSVNGVLNDLWRFDGTNWTWISGSTSVNQLGIYGVQGSAGSLNVPGSRNQGVAWVDGSSVLWLFGGFGYDQAGNIVHMNDLWKGKP
ncbi:MAG: fibronectin type III domain-containing protein, partial [Deltaproteobacteria bacterium]|nr:fibronectin type III domain-containing protein [Deltaproteobacteria bacterium]